MGAFAIRSRNYCSRLLVIRALRSEGMPFHAVAQRRSRPLAAHLSRDRRQPLGPPWTQRALLVQFRAQVQVLPREPQATVATRSPFAAGRGRKQVPQSLDVDPYHRTHRHAVRGLTNHDARTGARAEADRRHQLVAESSCRRRLPGRDERRATWWAARRGAEPPGQSSPTPMTSPPAASLRPSTADCRVSPLGCPVGAADTATSHPVEPGTGR